MVHEEVDDVRAALAVAQHPDLGGGINVDALTRGHVVDEPLVEGLDDVGAVRVASAQGVCVAPVVPPPPLRLQFVGFGREGVCARMQQPGEHAGDQEQGAVADLVVLRIGQVDRPVQRGQVLEEPVGHGLAQVRVGLAFDR